AGPLSTEPPAVGPTSAPTCTLPPWSSATLDADESFQSAPDVALGRRARQQGSAGKLGRRARQEGSAGRVSRQLVRVAGGASNVGASTSRTATARITESVIEARLEHTARVPQRHRHLR